MRRVALYPIDSERGWAALYPAPGFDPDEIFRKDVPIGAPYRVLEIGDDETVPDDLEPDFAAPDGYGIGHDAWVADRAASDIIEAGEEGDG